MAYESSMESGVNAVWLSRLRKLVEFKVPAVDSRLVVHGVLLCSDS